MSLLPLLLACPVAGPRSRVFLAALLTLLVVLCPAPHDRLSRRVGRFTEMVMASGKGSYVQTECGKNLLDFTCGSQSHTPLYLRLVLLDTDAVLPLQLESPTLVTATPRSPRLPKSKSAPSSMDR